MSDTQGDILFQIVPLFVGLIFCLVIGIFIYTIVTGFAEWSHNNSLPVTSVGVKVIGKNIETTHSNRHSGGSSSRGYSRTTSSTVRTITFEDTFTGERHVFTVNRRLFDLVFEGDKGTLTHQGTRFKDFNRD